MVLMLIEKSLWIRRTGAWSSCSRNRFLYLLTVGSSTFFTLVGLASVLKGGAGQTAVRLPLISTDSLIPFRKSL